MAGSGSATYDIVIPTVGRPSLARLIEALDRSLAAGGPLPGQVVLVDDRRERSAALSVGQPSERLRERLVLRNGRAAGPAAARNAGWQTATATATAEWVAFLDDDVLPPPSWAGDLAADLAGLAADVGGTQGRVRVPLPDGRRPTDWERNVGGLEGAAWATADMAYRRAALTAVGGFDERFPRAYREDADLALRVQQAGWQLVRGDRWVSHPVRPADRWVSVRLQAGNVDDALMLGLHGPGWRERAAAPPGRRRRHVAVTAAGLGAATALLARRPALASAAAGVWLAGTAELAWARIAPGPRTADEVATMLATSAALPAAATAWSVVGAVRWRRLLLSQLRLLARP